MQGLGIEVLYLASAVLFILGLRGLSSPNSARRGMFLAEIGMLLAIIGTLLHQPELVILDEPFSGLDPVNSKVMRDIVVEIARNGGTVLFSTHIMEQAEKMCDRVAIIARGEKVVDGKLADVKRDAGGRHIALAFHRNQDAAARVLSDRSLVARVDDYGVSAEAQLAEGVDSDRLLAALVSAGAGVSRFEVVEPSLHSIFVARVGEEAASAPARGDA